jgi:hypothetical protein
MCRNPDAAALRHRDPHERTVERFTLAGAVVQVHKGAVFTSFETLT